MTKQELEKAIKNGESVWINGFEHKLNKYYFVAEYNNEPTLYLMTCGYEEDDWNNYPVETITNIYKTQAEAEHYLHHANVTRTETLLFLTWEEFLKEYSFDFYCRNHEWFTMYWNDVDGIVIESIDGFYKKTWDLTEANFYKAYDECVRLFKGEE